MRRDFDGIDQALFKVLRSHVLPCLAPISGQVNKAIIAAGPDHPFFMRGFRDVADGAIVFRSNGLDRVRPSPLTLFVIQILCQIWRDFLPGLTKVAGTEQNLSGVIISIGFMLRPYDWRVPVEQVLHIAGGTPQILNRCRHDPRTSRGLRVENLDGSQITATENMPRIVGVECEKGALASSRSRPTLFRDTPAPQFKARDPN